MRREDSIWLTTLRLTGAQVDINTISILLFGTGKSKPAGPGEARPVEAPAIYRNAYETWFTV
ncbi:hypothetical protein [Fodinibius salsisoli]|uniref:Uncharacterized protein n=1 Tax=Fodinibius salsisoli TaxID=2820877 RepID=A0ABT3PT25_9BACT|nr:hypothetical protein [Fodinibius salsisoli]MCW9709018.1 hypothetical protein [Fodinibius salsisoli]